MNNVSLVGRICQDLVLMQPNENVTLVNYCIAVPRQSKNKETDFINCVSFGKMAENIVRFFQKGSMMAVTGELQQQQYTDKNGQKVSKHVVKVNSFTFVDSKKIQETQRGVPSPNTPSGYTLENLPFDLDRNSFTTNNFANDEF